MSGVDEVVEQDERIDVGGHDEGVGPIVQRRVAVHELIVQDGAARIGRTGEPSDVLSIDRKGDVGRRDGPLQRVREDVEHIHCGSGELYSYRRRGGPRRKNSGIVPGLPVDLAEV